MNITIIGGGNVGTQFAVHCAEKGHRVRIYTSKPDLFTKKIEIVNEDNVLIHTGTIDVATNSYNVALAEAELIFVTIPAFCMNQAADEICKYVKPGMLIGLVPGTGGGECAFKSCIERGAIVFGLQRVPSVARLVEYGKTVRAVGYRNRLAIAAIPGAYCETCCKIVESIFDIACERLSNYLNVTLTPSNPILHTTRLYILFKHYYNGKNYSRIPYFYEEWDVETSELLLKCDDEVQMVCTKLEKFDLREVRSLKVHYESKNAETLTKKIRSIMGFKGLLTPMKMQGAGCYIPDFSSRYFIADFSYGLSIIIQVAEIAGVNTPNMRMVYEWYCSIVSDRTEFKLEDYSIRDIDELYDFYDR